MSHWNRKRQTNVSEWNSRFFSPLLRPPLHVCFSLPLWRQSRQPRNVLPGYGSLSKLNNTCQESPTHNQLCNTGGSHYVSIFAQPWPRSVYYTIKTHPCFHFAQVLPVYILSCYFLKVEAHYYFVLCCDSFLGLVWKAHFSEFSTEYKWHCIFAYVHMHTHLFFQQLDASLWILNTEMYDGNK